MQFITISMCLFGFVNLTRGQQPFNNYIKNNSSRLVLFWLSIGSFLLYIDFSMACFKFYILGEINQKKILQEEISHVMENLDECILTKN